MKHSHFELSRAVYCESCRCVSDSTALCCCCGAGNLLNLASILNRTAEQDSAAKMWRELEALRA